MDLDRRPDARRARSRPALSGTPGIFALANEDRLRRLLTSVGFTVERIEDVPMRFVYRDVDDYVRRARDTGGLFATVWRAASDEEREAMRARLGTNSPPFAVDGGYELPASHRGRRQLSRHLALKSSQT